MYEFTLLDFGIHERVTSSSVRYLPVDLINVPAMGMRCKVSHFSYAQHVWKTEDFHIQKHGERLDAHEDFERIYTKCAIDWSITTIWLGEKDSSRPRKN